MANAKLISKTNTLASAEVPGLQPNDAPRILWFSKTNSSWYDWQIAGKKVGDQFEVADDAIVLSNQGRWMVTRLGAEKAIAAVTLETAYLKRDLELKRAAQMDAMSTI